MEKTIYLMLLLLASVASLKAQVVIGSDRDPVSGAVLELVSTDKVLILPQITSLEQSKLKTAGLIVYNTSTNKIEFCCSNGQWKALNPNGASASLAQQSYGIEPSVVTGVKISDRSGSQQFSASSVLELESTSGALLLSNPTTLPAAQKSMICFVWDDASKTKGRLSFSEQNNEWLKR